MRTSTSRASSSFTAASRALRYSNSVLNVGEGLFLRVAPRPTPRQARARDAEVLFRLPQHDLVLHGFLPPLLILPRQLLAG